MTQQEMRIVKRAVIKKYPIFAGIALFQLPIVENNKIDTLSVLAEKNKRGKLEVVRIEYSPEFMDNLTFKQQVFVLAHEAAHIAFEHISRSLNNPQRDIEIRYQEFCRTNPDERLRKLKLIELTKKYENLWNIATDACINAFLTNDGLENPQGAIDKRTGEEMHFINITDGAFRSADAIYKCLVKKDDELQQRLKENSSKKSNSGESARKNGQQELGNNISRGNYDISADDFDIGQLGEYRGFDSHHSWSAAAKKSAKPNQFRNMIRKIFGLDDQKTQGERKNSPAEGNQNTIDESEIFRKNAEKLNESQLNRQSTGTVYEKIREINGAPHQGEPAISWQSALTMGTTPVKESNFYWSYRRSSRANPNPRLAERSQEKKRAVTEIVLDTSGSIEKKLLQGFLSQIYELYKYSEIRIGCFSGTFHGFTEINSIEDIINYKPISDGGGTNFEAAATAFSKVEDNVQVNRIVFTDGELDKHSSHVQRTRVDGIKWIIFGDKMNFQPLGGEIIKISDEAYKEMLRTPERKFNFECQKDQGAFGNTVDNTITYSPSIRRR